MCTYLSSLSSVCTVYMQEINDLVNKEIIISSPLLKNAFHNFTYYTCKLRVVMQIDITTRELHTVVCPYLTII